MGCISNITGAITYDCLGGAVGIADLLLINYSDIHPGSVYPKGCKCYRSPKN